MRPVFAELGLPRWINPSTMVKSSAASLDAQTLQMAAMRMVLCIFLGFRVGLSTILVTLCSHVKLSSIRPRAVLV